MESHNNLTANINTNADSINFSETKSGNTKEKDTKSLPSISQSLNMNRNKYVYNQQRLKTLPEKSPIPNSSLNLSGSMMKNK